MTFYITNNPRRPQHTTSEDAERAIEIYFPPGYLYEVVKIQYRSQNPKYAVKAYKTNSGRFQGYCWDTTRIRGDLI